ncbi:unnamed protein product [Caenorhabditis angaria]|uniref:Uncharacterized protein n=1 Tax=Caenorhabditis angaria TaxID=860376 RepID=A0A9P1N029_9PELO|nr:unnamed protein product [Caenorhabditis angaria]
MFSKISIFFIFFTLIFAQILAIRLCVGDLDCLPTAIFICGKFIGGFNELSNLKNSGKLLEALAECTGENSKIFEA